MSYFLHLKRDHTESKQELLIEWHTVAQRFLTKTSRNIFDSALESSSALADHYCTTIYFNFNVKRKMQRETFFFNFSLKGITLHQNMNI